MQDTDSGIFTHHHETSINPDNNRDSGRKSIKPRQSDTQKTKKNITVGYEGNGVFYADHGPKGNNKRTSLILFGSDDLSSSDSGRHQASRQSVMKLSGTGMKASDYSIRKTSYGADLGECGEECERIFPYAPFVILCLSCLRKFALFASVSGMISLFMMSEASRDVNLSQLVLTEFRKR